MILEDDFQDQWFKVKLKDVLYQLDCGFDYEEGSLEATSMCDCCKEVDNNKMHTYVTRICEGQPELDSGKFHNH